MPGRPARPGERREGGREGGREGERGCQKTNFIRQLKNKCRKMEELKGGSEGGRVGGS